MFFGGKDKKKNRQGEPPEADSGKAINLAVQVAVLALIGYAFFQYITGGEPSKSALRAPDQSAAAPARNERCLCVPDEGARLFGTFWPVPEPLIQQEVLAEGTGPQALCGQDMRVRVTPVKGGYFDGKKDAPFTFRAGERKTLRGLELGALEMRAGGRSRFQIPPVYAYLHSPDPAAPQKEVVTLEAELLEAAPAPPVSAMPSRAFPTVLGDGAMAKCGDRVAVQLDLWSQGSELLFSTRMGERPAGPLIFTLGMGQAPFAVEQALLSLRPGAEASFIFPAALLARFNPPLGTAAAAYPPLPGDIPWPQDGIAVADLALIEVLDGDAAEAETMKEALPLLLGGEKAAQGNDGSSGGAPVLPLKESAP